MIGAKRTVSINNQHPSTSTFFKPKLLIRTKLIVSAVITIGLALAVAVTVSLQYRNVGQATRTERFAHRVIKDLSDLDSLSYAYLLFKDKRPKVQWHLKHTSIGKLLSEDVAATPDEHAVIARLRSNHQQMKDLFNVIAKNIEEIRAETKSAFSPYDELNEGLVAQLLSRSEMIMYDASLLVGETARGMDAVRRRALFLVVASAFILMVSASLTAFLLTKSIGGWIRALERGTQTIAAGGLAHRVDVHGSDELGRLAAAFNDMAAKLETSYLSLEKEIGERKQAQEALKELNETLEQRVAERTQELRESEARLRLAQERGDVGVWDWYPSTGEENFSDEMNRIYGLSSGTIKTYQDWLSRVHPEDVKRMETERDAALAEHKPFDLEFRVFHGSGDVRWIAARGGAEYDDHGRITRVLGVNFDITNIKHTEEALQKRTLELEHLTETLEQRVRDRTADVEKERRRLYDVLETMPAMVCLLTPDYHVAFANRSFRERFGESHGRHCYDYCFGKTEPCDFCESYSVLKTGQAHRWEVTSPDGSIIDAHDFPFTDVDGSPMILEMDTDITQRKRAEEALKERTADLANLSSHLVSAQENERKRISYDLHDNVWQTLVAIRFEIERLFSRMGKEDEVVLNKRSKEVMADILGAVGKIRSMQGDLWPYVLDDIGLLATIDWYCREFGKNHSGLAIECRMEFGEDKIPPSAKIVIYRVMQEAMGNAAKHSQASHVCLSLIEKNHTMEFTIVDDGIGFDPQTMFLRRNPWVGLGLLSVKARIELSGGTFGVESSRGKGTTVRASWALT